MTRRNGEKWLTEFGPWSKAKSLFKYIQVDRDGYSKANQECHRSYHIQLGRPFHVSSWYWDLSIDREVMSQAPIHWSIQKYILRNSYYYHSKQHHPGPTFTYITPSFPQRCWDFGAELHLRRCETSARTKVLPLWGWATDGPWEPQVCVSWCQRTFHEFSLSPPNV